MIRNPGLLRELDAAHSSAEKSSLEYNLRILDSLYQEAVSLGVFPPKDPLQGIETDIRLAAVLNHVRTSNRKNRKSPR